MLILAVVQVEVTVAVAVAFFGALALEMVLLEEVMEVLLGRAIRVAVAVEVVMVFV